MNIAYVDCTGSIPKELGALSKLDTFLVNDNPLEGEDVKESHIVSFSIPANTDDTAHIMLAFNAWSIARGSPPAADVPRKRG